MTLSRWAVPLPILAALSAPILLFAATRYQSADYLSELTIYRIGNAVSLIFGEPEYVKPVQGLPIALLSKLITWALLTFNTHPLISTPSIQAYMLIYFSIVTGVAVFAVLWAWPSLNDLQRVGAVSLFGVPWLCTGSLPLFMEPDYWVGEWAYLIVSFCILCTMRRRAMPLIAIGAWLAVGAAMKITLLGIAPLFWFAQESRSVKSLAVVLAALLSTFVLIDVVYIGGIETGLRLLRFQINFFAHPNKSVSYTSFKVFYEQNPSLIALYVASAIVLLANTGRKTERCFAGLWLASLAGLIWIRPHDTSVASAAAVATFVIFYFVSSIATMAAATALLLLAGWATNFQNFQWAKQTVAYRGQVGPTEVFPASIAGMLFFPDNYWNAGVAVQAMGYNGELGYYYPVESAPDGRPRYKIGAKAFQVLFPNTVFIADSAESLAVAVTGLRAGVPMWWTQQNPLPNLDSQNSADRVAAIAAAAGATILTTPFTANGQKWLLQRATLENKD